MTPTTPRKGSFMNVEIAQRLATMRREQGYSQEELAERLGLSRQAVSKWERAESSPDIGNIVALAKLYGVTVDELLRVEDDLAGLEDDMRFEERDRSAAAEAEAQQAAVRANEAAVRAAQAAVAAAQARASAEQAHAQPQPQPQPAAQPQPMSQPQPMPQPQTPYAPPSPPSASYDSAHDERRAAHDERRAAHDERRAAHDERRRRGPWSTFPYPILCVIVFLFAGFFPGWWHPAWVVFLTIPLYYWIAHIIENDPNYRDNRR